MEVLGIGPLELLFIVLIALIVLGPKDMAKAGKTIGRTMRAIVSSDTWKIINQASREIRNLPNRLMQESGIDELQKQMPTQSDLRRGLGQDDLNKSIQASTPKEFAPPANRTPDSDLSPWTTAPPDLAPPDLAPPDMAPHTIAPPRLVEGVESPPAPPVKDTDQQDAPSGEDAQG